MTPEVVWAVRASVDDVTRDSARQAAERELLKPEYHHVKPLVVRAFDWLIEHLGRLLSRAAEAAPGGAWGLVGLVLLVVLLAVLVRLRLGGFVDDARRAAVFDPAHERTAAEHRAAAEQAAAGGDWQTAVRERFRAVVRGLEERAVLEPRLGRTADEAAAEGGVAFPDSRSSLRSAARVFDDVVYGGRPATEDAYRQVSDVDQVLHTSQPVLA